MNRIPNKRLFYSRWHAGKLGNRPRTWESLEALRASGFPGPVGIRSIGVQGGLVRYRVPLARLRWAAPTPSTTFSRFAVGVIP